MRKITPFLWFDTQAEEAAEFYVSVFRGRPGAPADDEATRVVDVARYGDAGPGAAGTVLTVEFRLEGQTIVGLNGGPAFRFTEAFSLQVSCESQEEVDYFWQRFTEGGGEEGQCGWLKDRYGLSWQIVPTVLPELMQDPDPARAERATKAMMEMRKLDIDALRRAADAA